MKHRLNKSSNNSNKIIHTLVILQVHKENCKNQRNQREVLEKLVKNLKMMKGGNNLYIPERVREV